MAQNYFGRGSGGGGAFARLLHVLEHVLHMAHSSRQAKIHARKALEADARGDTQAAAQARATAEFHKANYRARTGAGGVFSLFSGYFKTFK